MAFSGGFRYNPTTSTSLSSNFGSLDNLNVSTRCGLSPRADHTCCTVDFDTPVAAAMVLQLHWVSPWGRQFKVRSTISSIVSCGMDFLRPRPWRTWANLTSPSSANRTRHPLTDAGDTDNAWAIAVFAKPSAAINNARARTTSRCGADHELATVSRTSRCPGDTNSAGTGGRIPGSIPTNHQLITGHTTSIASFNAPVTSGRRASSRSRPTRPDHGRRPGPNGGTPRDRRNGVKGQNDSHGTEPASAAAAAPQQFASTRTASGRTWEIAPRRSSTSYAARRPNTLKAAFNAARPFVSIQSVITAASIRGSIADDSTPTSRPIVTPSSS